MDWSENFAEAIVQLRSTLSPEELEMADRVHKFHIPYLGLGRDPAVALALKRLVLNIAGQRPGGRKHPNKRRILAVCGDSGSGKTRALLEHTGKIPAMRPYLLQGTMYSPFLGYEAPSPCTPNLLAQEGLRALGVDVKSTIKENAAWDLFRNELKAHRVLFVLIDEAQHAVNTANRIEAQKIADAFKNLVQMPDWPVRLILAGVPPLDEFLSTEKQLFNRRTLIRFEKLHGKRGLESIREVLGKVIQEHAGLQLGEDLDGDFAARLSHASDGDFGSVIQMIRDAAEIVIATGRAVVEKSDFAATYDSFTGCTPDNNVFRLKGDAWVSLKPLRAYARPEDHDWRSSFSEAAAMPRSKKKTVAFGDRP
ncbi:ATP-binding protein [Ensifer sp. 22521]|uniref:ATP-binding protein n=1 Tax=Ensifer sp. 22521 TaxID=3453935 RepID=UPI003F83BBCD